MFQFEFGDQPGNAAAMQVLLTGAFGRLGRVTLQRLVEEGDRVVAFDIKTPANERVARRFAGESRVQTVWGDIRDASQVEDAVRGVQAVVHGAGILSPASEINPKLAFDVNVNGTKNVLAACEAQPEAPRVVLASSLSVGGVRAIDGPVLLGTDPPVATDHYTSHKTECEHLVSASSLQWVILRIGPSVAADGMDGSDMGPDTLRLIFNIDQRTKLEYVHPKDVAVAKARAVRCADAVGKVLMIGGGPSCQLTFGEFNARLFDAVGLGKFPDEAFGTMPYYCQWMDTEQSQAILEFQERSFDDHVREVLTHGRYRRPLIRLLSPMIRRWMLRHSEPWQASRSR